MKFAKTSFLIIIAILAGTSSRAQNRQKVSIDKITVFMSGAEIENSTRISLPQGESEVIFTNIAGNILQQSISVGAGNGVIIQSATPKNDYLGENTLSPVALKIRDSIDLLNQQVQTLNDKKNVLNEQLTIIKENRKVAGENTGLSVTELQKLLDLVNNKMNGLLSETHQLGRQSGKLNERIKLLQQQLSEEQKKDFQPGGQLVVRFYASQATSTNIQISYVTPNASWTPSYDIRVDKIDQPVKLVYKANIIQNTGVKWDNVKLSLSTGNPNEGAEAPVVNPWYLAFHNPMPRYEYTNKARLNRATGYSENEMLMSADMAAAPQTKTSSIGNYVEVDNSGINTTFDIALNYTIPSDGQEHLVAVKDYELPASYRYYVAPKLDRDAFLQARITNWEDLNLMPASTNIFYEGAYVGQGYIDMRNVKDTLNLSLGRDKKIIVRRENDKDYRTIRTIGSNVKRNFAYTIEVRNTRKEAINLIVLEQFPISNENSINVEDKEANEAQIDEGTGAVQWDIHLKANETKTLKLKYAVKYPKDKNIGNL